MRLTGTLASATQLAWGTTVVPIKLSCNLPKGVMQRHVDVDCELCTYHGHALVKVASLAPAKHPDTRMVTVTGFIAALDPPRANGRGRQSARIRLWQKKGDRTSAVLFTLLDSKIAAIDFGNLSIGQRLTLSGQIAYHSCGYHVVCSEASSEEGGVHRE